MLNKRVFVLILVSAALVCAPAFSESAGWARPDLLITPKKLAGILRKPDVRVVDARPSSEYKKGHIPNAVNIFFSDLANFQSRKKNGFPAFVADAERIFSKAGIDKDTTVIVYDSGHGPVASGVWFALEFFGHEKVKILNGGLRKWEFEHWPVTTKTTHVKKRKFVAHPHPPKIITGDQLKETLGAKDIMIVDTRSDGEYTGKRVFRGNDRGGHIPGAKLINWRELMGEMDTFKSPDKLIALLEKNGITKDTKVITYCQQGIGRSTDLALAMKLLGYDNAREYTGSWQEWSNNTKFPVEK